MSFTVYWITQVIENKTNATHSLYTLLILWSLNFNFFTFSVSNMPYHFKTICSKNILYMDVDASMRVCVCIIVVATEVAVVRIIITLIIIIIIILKTTIGTINK